MFPLSTAIGITWLMYSNRLFCRTSRSCYLCLYKNLDWSAAELDELARAFSLLVKLPNSSKNKVFYRRMRDFDFETLPWRLSAGDITYYNHEQKEKGKALVQMHTDFAPVLKVLFHTALDCF